MNIILGSNEFKIKSIKRKSTANFFKDLVVGDRICFNYELKRQPRSSGRLYATTITCFNVKTYDEVEKSPSELVRILEAFELEEIHEYGG